MIQNITKLSPALSIATGKSEAGDTLPESLYESTPKIWSSKGIIIQMDVIDELEEVLRQYMLAIGLDETLYPARVDLGFDSKGTPVIYEITTGFVDQVGSLIAINTAQGDPLSDYLDVLSEIPYSASTLTLSQYRAEYDLMRSYVAQAGKDLEDVEMTQELCFVYGYPRDDMSGASNYIPGARGLAAENKLSQYQILSSIPMKQLRVGELMTVQNYDQLPDTPLIFKQIQPKQKGQRNTISKIGGKSVKNRFNAGEMIAQEYIEPMLTPYGIIECKAIFLPTASGSRYLGAYSLFDTDPNSSKIINDGFPQGFTFLDE